MAAQVAEVMGARLGDFVAAGRDATA